VEILQQPVVIMSGLAVAVVIILFATFARMLRKVGVSDRLEAVEICRTHGFPLT